MEAQLDFTWNQEPAIWKPTPQIFPPQQQNYELPAQLDFRLAEMPSIPSDKPVPLSYTNSIKKLIQYQRPGAQSSKTKSKIASNPKPQSKQMSKIKHPQTLQPKPEWNNRGNTLGLFDAGISKKLPIEIKHAIKNDPNLIKKPKTFQDIGELPNKTKTIDKSKSSKQVKMNENLDVKFIADQEEIVKSLEKQLKTEKIARKELDEKFTQKMKEMENFSRKVEMKEKVENNEKVFRTGYEVKNGIQGNQVPLTNYSKKLSIQQPGLRPCSKSNKNLRSPQVCRDFTEFNQEYVKMNQVPISELGPIVLRADSSPEPRPKPTHQKTSSSPISNQKYAKSKTQIDPKAIHPPNPQNYNQPQHTSHSNPHEAHQLPQPSHLNQSHQITHKIPSKAQTQNFEYQTTDICENDPVLNSISAAMIRYKAAHNYSTKTTSPLISHVGAKYIAYYANELSDMLIDDILEDTVDDLQHIEQAKFKQAHINFSNEAENHFNTIVQEFENEARLLQAKHVAPKNKSKDVLDRILNDWDEGEIVIEDRRREWTVELSCEIIESLRTYKKKFEEFQRVNAGGSDGKLWDIYAVIGDDLVNEAIAEVTQEYDETLQEFTDKFMNNEFA